MAFWDRKDDDHTERRREATTKRREASAEKKEINNAKARQKVKDKEARQKVRAQNGGTGFKMVFFSKRAPKHRVTVNRRRAGTKRKGSKRPTRR